ncbi:MAG: glycosyltransferase family 2 protein [Bacteroidota bacterium]
MPFFSVIIPSYNRAHLLPKAIQCVLNQTFTSYELIIVDDGSSDTTKEIVESYLIHPHIKYLYQSNNGVCAARNTGARNAVGQFIVFLDSDDEVSPNWLHDFFLVSQLDSFDVVFCDMEEVSDRGERRRVLAKKPYANRNVLGLFLAGVFAIKKTLFDEIGGYDELLKFGENTELGIRLRMKDIHMGFTEACNFFYKISIGEGGKNSRNKMESNIRIVEKHTEYFKKNPNTKRLFLQVAAVSAIKIGEYRKANRIFEQLKNEFPKDLKLRMQCFISSFPWLSDMVWKNKKNIRS